MSFAPEYCADSSTPASSMYTPRSDAGTAPTSFQSQFVEDDNLLYISISIAALVAYDTITTMDMEITHFWRNIRTTNSWIYLLNRYIGLLGAISNATSANLHAGDTLCRFSQWCGNFSAFLIIVLVDYILMKRVLALYYNEKKLVIFLSVLFCIEATLGLFGAIYGSIQDKFASVQIEDIAVCTNGPPIPIIVSTLTWVAPLVFGCVLLGLALYQIGRIRRTSDVLHGYGLIRVVVQDQGLYYTSVVFCTIAQMAFDIVGSNSAISSVLAVVASPSLLSVLGCHLMIHLKEAGHDLAKGRDTNGDHQANQTYYEWRRECSDA